MPADSVNGNPLSFAVDSSGNIMVNEVNVTDADINASNGIIHVIDKVLIPTATPNDIPRTAECSGVHNTLVEAVVQANLLETLQGEGPFTVFAPTDQAFADAGIDLTTLNQSELSDILLYHVVAANLPATAIDNAIEQTMANQNKTTFSTASGLMINGANITSPAIEASNGLIYVIDKVLLPQQDVVEDSNDETESSSDDDSISVIWIIVAVLALLGAGVGGVLFARGRKSGDSTSKDFSSSGLMNQLESVDDNRYTGQVTQQINQPNPIQTVEVINQPANAEPVILRQWTDDAGYTWRAMDDGNKYWWTGADWQKYG